MMLARSVPATSSRRVGSASWYSLQAGSRLSAAALGNSSRSRLRSGASGNDGSSDFNNDGPGLDSFEMTGTRRVFDQHHGGDASRARHVVVLEWQLQTVSRVVRDRDPGMRGVVVIVAGHQIAGDVEALAEPPREHVPVVAGDEREVVGEHRPSALGCRVRQRRFPGARAAERDDDVWAGPDRCCVQRVPAVLGEGVGQHVLNAAAERRRQIERGIQARRRVPDRTSVNRPPAHRRRCRRRDVVRRRRPRSGTPRRRRRARRRSRCTTASEGDREASAVADRIAGGHRASAEESAHPANSASTASHRHSSAADNSTFRPASWTTRRMRFRPYCGAVRHVRWIPHHLRRSRACCAAAPSRERCGSTRPGTRWVGRYPMAPGFGSWPRRGHVAARCGRCALTTVASSCIGRSVSSTADGGCRATRTDRPIGRSGSNA